MASLTPTEIARGQLAQLRPETLAALTRLMADYEAATGNKTTVPDYGGYRTAAQQQQLRDWRDEEKATYAVGGVETSRHVWGGAFDLKVLTLVGGKWTVLDAWQGGKVRPEYVKLGELGEKLGLKWGGRWSGKDTDPYHFQRNETLAQAQAAYVAFAGRNLQGGAGGAGVNGVVAGPIGSGASSTAGWLLIAGIALAIVATDD